MNRETFKTDLAKQRRRRKDQLDLRQIAGFAKNINIALIELTETSFLRTVSTEYRSDLQCLEGLRQLIHMVGVVTNQRNRQVVAQAAVRQIFFAGRGLQVELLTALHDLKNQLLVIAALLAGQVRKILHNRSLNRRKAEALIGFFNESDQVIPDLHLLRQNILHTGHRLFR